MGCQKLNNYKDLQVHARKSKASGEANIVQMWLSVDPLAEKFPGYSPYNFCMNNPVGMVDPDGRAPDDWRINYTDKNGNAQTFIFNGGATALPDNQFVKDFVGAYNYNVGNGGGQAMKAIATNSNMMVDVQQGEFSIQENSSNFNVIDWNSSTGLETTSGYILSPATILEHEADHALKGATSPNVKNNLAGTPDAKYDNKEEKRVITGSEQRTARANGEIPMIGVSRNDHSGQPVKTTSPTSNKVDRQKTYNFLSNQNSKGNYFPGFDTEKYKN